MNGTVSESLVVYENEESTRRMIETAVLGYGISHAILINAHYMEHSKRRTAMEGLDVALTFVGDGRPIIVYSIYRPEYHAFVEDARYHALKGYPHVEFLDIIGSLKRFVEKVDHARERTRPSDLLAIALLDLAQKKNMVSILQHDLNHAHTQGRMTEWLDRARALGFFGSDATVIEMAKAWKTHSACPFQGQFLSGIFCDVQGTLLNDRGELNTKLVAYLRAESEKKPITLWTGGDVESARTTLAPLVPWKVTSKLFFGGATVEIAIDDAYPEALLRDYGFFTQSFIKAPQDLLDMGLL